MTYIEYFKLLAKNLSKDYKTKTPYIDDVDGNTYFNYNPKYFDIDRILVEYDWDETKFSLMNAQNIIAQIVGFKKWTDLLKASEVELELAKLLFDNQDKIWLEYWEMYIAGVERDNKITFNHESRLEIFKQVFLNIDNLNPGIENIDNPFGDYRLNFRRNGESAEKERHLMGMSRGSASGKFYAYNMDGIMSHNVHNPKKKAAIEKCEHIEKKLFKGEPLTDEMLELMLELIPNTEEKHFNGVKTRDKLKNGEVLDSYELHIVCDFFLLHAKIFL